MVRAVEAQSSKRTTTQEASTAQSSGHSPLEVCFALFSASLQCSVLLAEVTLQQRDTLQLHRGDTSGTDCLTAVFPTASSEEEWLVQVCVYALC